MEIPTHNKSEILTSAYSGLAAAVGNTPLLLLKNISAHLSPNVQIYAKAEWLNPGGSVKDRPALNILLKAIDAGEFEHGKRLLDSTSGNMGIAYATLGAGMGIPITLAIPSNASPERLALLQLLNAEVIRTDPLEGSDGAMSVAQQMANEAPERYYYADQYNNPANWQAHYQSTGPEIWNQAGGGVTHFVTGLGTTGTITGVSRYLREQNAEIEIIAFQPDSAFHGLEGLKHIPTSIMPGIFDPELPDRTLGISTEAAHEMTRRLGREEGLFVGVSSGAAAVAALEVAAEFDEGLIVTVFPDAGYKYLSEKFWDQAK